MKVREVVEKLMSYNHEAEVGVIVNNYKEEFSITFGGDSEGITKGSCKEVHFYVDRLCNSEKIDG